MADTNTITGGAPLGSTVEVYGHLNLHGDLDPTVNGIVKIETVQHYDYIDGSAIDQVQVSGNGIEVSQGANPFELGNATGYASETLSSGAAGAQTEINELPPPVIYYHQRYVVGVPTTFFVQLTVDAQASMQNYDSTNKNGGSVFSIGGYDDTLSWGGIDIVTDANGNPITGWSITSASGFDYTRPAPEPATLILLAITLPGLFLARSRYRHSCR